MRLPIVRQGKDDWKRSICGCSLYHWRYPLPTLPLRLTGDLFVPVDFETAYQEAFPGVGGCSRREAGLGWEDNDCADSTIPDSVLALDGRDRRHGRGHSRPNGASRGERCARRLLRATAALNQAGVPYAVVGGNAVASWVATVDEGAVRNTRDVDLLVRRSDLPAITAALEQAGFVGGELLDVVMFRDGAEGKPSEAIHLLFAGEKTRPDHLLPAPEIQTVNDPANFRVITLESLVVMKLMSNRRKDQVHICRI